MMSSASKRAAIPEERFANPGLDLKSIVLPVCMMAVLAVTNLWSGFNYGVSDLGQTDTASYRAIAMASPNIPREPIAYHHAQRFWLPWLLGGVTRLTGFPLELLFRITTVALLTGVTLLFFRILKTLQLPSAWEAVLAAALVFNPYCGRYYLAVPFMASELLFVLGFSIIVMAVVEDNAGAAAVGLAVSAFGRQTALPVMLAVWVWLGWRLIRGEKNARDSVKISAASLAACAIYAIGGWFAQSTGAISENTAHVTGLATWLVSGAPSKIPQAAEFVLRGLVSESTGLMLLTVLAVFCRQPKPKAFWMLGLLVLSVWAQPVLGGPAITGNNIVRLLGLSYVGILTMTALLARELKKDLPIRSLVIVIICMLIGSMHHRWSWPGKIFVLTPDRFAWMLSLNSLIAGMVIWFEVKRNDGAGFGLGRRKPIGLS